MTVWKAEVEEWKKAKKQNPEAAGPEPEQPVQKRYMTHYTGYEALHVLMQTNPFGILGHRDELISLLKHLDQEINTNAKGFFMQAWNGDDGYAMDRIGRGHVYAEHVCLSLFGSATPSMYAAEQ
jgi:putative DNA primase/helicase